MAALKTHKRRPVAPTKDKQLVNFETIGSLKPEKTVESYHVLFMNIELLINPMVDHGLADDVITIVNTARLAQHARDLPELDAYLAEITTYINRWQEESDRVAKKADTEQYSPEATIKKLSNDNPKTLTPDEGGEVVTLTVTVRLSQSLMPTAAAMLKAEQVYGPFWTVKARCFVVNKKENAATAYVNYLKTHKKFAKREFRLLPEYKLSQNNYKNVDIYMLVDLPRLVALRNTKIMEIGMATREEIRKSDIEARMPIIEKAEAIVSKLPKVVSAESKHYMVHRLVERMLHEEKQAKIRNARYGRDGAPKQRSAASTILATKRFAISEELASKIGVPMQEMHKAISNNRVSSYVGAFLRVGGRELWQQVSNKVHEWHKLKKLSEV